MVEQTTTGTQGIATPAGEQPKADLDGKRGAGRPRSVPVEDFEKYQVTMNQTVEGIRREMLGLVSQERARADSAEAATRAWEEFPDDPDRRQAAQLKLAAESATHAERAELQRERLSLKARELRGEFNGLPADLFTGLTTEHEMEVKATRWALGSRTPSASLSADDNEQPPPYQDTANPGSTTMGGPAGMGDFAAQRDAMLAGDNFDAKKAGELINRMLNQ